MTDYSILEAEFIHATKEAVKCDFGLDNEREVWVPFSVMDVYSMQQVRNANKGDSLELNIKVWFLEKEELV